MNHQKLITAIAEAERFLERARDAQNNPHEYDFVGTKYTGACRRASMDLTRALADLRRVG